MNTMAPLFAPLRPDDVNRAAYLRIEDRLRPFFEARVLSSTDVHVAAHLCRRTGQLEPDVALALALAVRAPSRAHICVNLETLQVEGLLDLEDHDDGDSDEALTSLTLPDNRQEWCQKVKDTVALVAGPQSQEKRPFVLDGSWLYVHRFWHYQCQIVDRVHAWNRYLLPVSDSNGQVARAMDILFRPPNKQVEDGQRLNRQRLAAARSLSTPFSVITGGPGMGKTWTVRNLIALLCLEHMDRHGPDSLPRIALAAPTGKAAMRIRESLLKGLESEFKPSLEACVSKEVCQTILDSIRGFTPKTLHRLLGYQRRNASRFRHSKSHPLVFDIVIVDEVSMVDFAMMAKLMDAMGESASGQPARLILLGDRDQLASVDAGTVLADICGPTVAARVEVDRTWAQGLKVNGLDLEAIASSDTSLQLVDRQRSMADAIVQFDRTYRFTKQSAIGRFASACIAEDFDAHKTIEPLISHDSSDAHLIEYDDERSDDVWAQVDGVIKEAFEPFCRLINLDWTKDAARFPTQEVYWRRCIEAFDRFRILCAHRKGKTGVAGFNQRCLKVLARQTDYPQGLNIAGTHWAGRPVLISRNDYGANLFNGDIGLIFRTHDGSATRWIAVFPGRDSLPSEDEMEHRNWAWVEGKDYGGDLSIVQTLSVERLPPHETVFAMTIHKSQGSEFDHVMMALPDASKRLRILTRELIYTGVTRAKREITIVGRKELLAESVAESIRRASCLRDKLWNGTI